MKEKLILSCRDVSLGGILVAIAKMCIKGKKGVKLNKLKSLINKFEFFFSEDQGRYIIEISKKNLKNVEKINRLENLKIPKGFDFASMKSLSNEAKEKLMKISPTTLAQASRISGVSPSDISSILVKIGR